MMAVHLPGGGVAMKSILVALDGSTRVAGPGDGVRFR